MVGLMHAALIADTAWLTDELAMFKFLGVGLMGEQVRVAQVVPACTTDQQISAFGDRVIWHESRFDLVRSHRLAGLAGELDELRINVLHALDGRLWAGALRLAERLGVPAVLNVACIQDVTRAIKLRRNIAACRTAFAAATEPLAQAIREHAADPTLIRHLPPGAHMPAEAVCPKSNDALCLVITGNGVCDTQYQTLFEALRLFIEDHRDTLLFFDSQGGDQHPLWQAARRHGVLDNSSMIPTYINHREMLSGAHALVQPQTLGRARSVTLQAMACGLPVLARHDQWLDYLIDDQTAWTTEHGDVEDWLRLFRRIRDDPIAVQKMGLTARQWIGQHHLAAAQVEHTIELYRQLTGESYRFPQAQEHNA